MSSAVYELLVHFFEVVILSSLYINLLQPKLKTVYSVAICLAAAIPGIAIAPSYLLVRVFLVAAFEFIIIAFLFEDKFTRKLGVFFSVAAICVISGIISYILMDFFSGKQIEFTQRISYYDCTFSLLYLILLSTVASMVLQITKRIRGIELPWLLGTQVVICMGECAAVLAFARFNDGGIRLRHSGFVLFSTICLVAANLSIGFLFSYFIRRFTLLCEIDFGTELSNMEYRYYEMSLENDKKLHALRHDISNQIQTIYSLLISGERQKSIEMVNELKERYSHVEQLNYCENSVLNIILANKKDEAEKQGIETQIKVKDLSEDIPVSDFDLSTVACNMIDNAIRGCVCSNQPQPKMIVEIVCKNQYLVIRVLNTCIVNLNIENTDRIESTKSTSQTHGFGMAIIANTVKKYRGDFVVSAQNGLFTATAIMSIK